MPASWNMFFFDTNGKVEIPLKSEWIRILQPPGPGRDSTRLKLNFSIRPRILDFLIRYRKCRALGFRCCFCKCVCAIRGNAAIILLTRVAEDDAEIIQIILWIGWNSNDATNKYSETVSAQAQACDTIIAARHWSI
jgi:hypothetical protein